MSDIDRRRFLDLLTKGGAAAATSGAAISESIARAASIAPQRRTGTIRDVEHIVILMQENRSFDHYFGTLQGVRGFSDPRAASLPSGRNVWAQPDGTGRPIFPFHPDKPDLGMAFVADLAHDWTSTHHAWNAGRWDGWIPAKTTTCMAYMTRDDIPFHYALADAFTICDAYHCSILSSTDPNRYYMWSGWVGNDGTGGGPVVDNAEAGYGWTTYPERLQEAGIDWKIYQDCGTGLNTRGNWGWSADPYVGNYGDNSLLYFNRYRHAPEGTPLAQRARTGTAAREGEDLFAPLRRDIRAGRLPQVSWIVAPEAYSEHPNWPANYGAWFIAQVLDALTESPEIWSRTALFVTYDENDGFFDHLIPPVPPIAPAQGQSTVGLDHEGFAGAPHLPAGPYGFGPRVPMIVASPWTTGGWVNSQVFDHTSLIRFIEARFAADHPGLIEPNITPWRRAVSGDLTSVFDFAVPATRTPHHLSSTAGFAPPDRKRHLSYIPRLPDAWSAPLQESGVRRARALPYDLHVRFAPPHAAGGCQMTFMNTGEAAAVFHLRDNKGKEAPRFHTVSPGQNVPDAWGLENQGGYDLAVHGPNGFFRRFAGGGQAGGVCLALDTRHDARERLVLISLTNQGSDAEDILFSDAYSDSPRSPTRIEAGASLALPLPAAAKSGWYDLTITASRDPLFALRLAGHIEDGQPSITDPLMGGIPDYQSKGAEE